MGRFAYIIGANGPEGMRLAYAEQDVKLLTMALEQPQCAFAISPITATSRRHTLSGLKKLANQCQAEDLLLVHFSGHAKYDEELFLYCNDSDHDDLMTTGVGINYVKKILRECQARTKVLILDCCYAASAHNEVFRGAQETEVRGYLNQGKIGGMTIILSACSRTEQARELSSLQAGFLSWAISEACTTHFAEASDQGALSFRDLYTWIGVAHNEVTAELATELPLPTIILEQEGFDNEVWLTKRQRTPDVERRRTSANLREKYLKQLCQHYSTVKFPLGPAEGFELHTIFQPLELRQDPLAAEDVEKRKHRPLLGEAQLYRTDESERPDNPVQRIIAEHSEDALRKSPQGRVVILGGPGTGKTTTLKHLMGQHARAALDDVNAPIPIFLDLARSEKALRSYLPAVVERVGMEASYAEVLWQEIEAGRAFLCLDGLDEVRPELRPELIEQINVQSQGQGNTWIVGSRFTEYKGGQFKRGQFAEWELLPLTHTRRLELAERLLPRLQEMLEIPPSPELTSTAFVTLLEGHPRAAAWGENPLLLSLAAVVFLRTQGLPESRAALYKEVIEAIIKTREQNEFWRASVLRQLGAFALWLHQYKGRVFRIADLHTFLTDVQGKSDTDAVTLGEHIRDSGIVEPVAPETYSFRHQTFQEYLAASEAARCLVEPANSAIRKTTWELLWSKRTYSRWIEILRLMVGILVQQHETRGWEAAESWLRALLQQRETEEGDPGNLGLLLAVTSLVELEDGPERYRLRRDTLQKEVLRGWAEQLFMLAPSRGERLQHLVRAADDIRVLGEEVRRFVIAGIVQVIEGSYDHQRWAAIEVLGHLGKDIPFDVLRHCMRDKDWDIRNAAAKACNQLPISILLHALQHDQNPNVRRAAARALGQAGEQIPIDALLYALQHDEDPSVRGTAAAEMRGSGKQIPVDALLQALQYDEDPNVRSVVARVLIEEGERIPIDALMHAQQYDQAPSVRSAVNWAFGQMQAYTFIPNLLHALHYDEVGYVRSSAATALGQMGKQIPINDLLYALQYDDEECTRSAAAEALGQAGEHMPINALLHTLQHDQEENVRSEAARALGWIDKKICIDALFYALQHEESPNVRSTIAKTLSNKSELMPIEDLLKALRMHPDIRSIATRTISASLTNESLAILLIALNDPQSSVRSAVIRGLAQAGKHAPIDTILSILQHDPDPGVRCRAAEALEQVGEQMPTDMLLSIAHHDQHMDVRYTVIRALGKAGKRMPIDALVSILQSDEYGQLRNAAAETLGEAGEQMPIAALLHALQYGVLGVRLSAARALGKAGARSPVHALLHTLQHDEHGYVRNAAAVALKQAGAAIPVDALLHTLQHDRQKSFRSAAVRALGQAGERIPIDTLLHILQYDKDKSLRSAAAEALGQAGERIPVDALLYALQRDKEEDVRRAAARALAEAGERVPGNTLLLALTNEDDEIRAAISEIFLKTDALTIPLEDVLVLLVDENEVVRENGLKLLLKKYPETIPTVVTEATAIVQCELPGAIFRPLTDRIIANVLGDMKLVDPIVFETLRPMLSSPNWKVRLRAIEALRKIRRSIPADIVTHLLELRRDSNLRMHAVRDIADETLAELLSLEAGIEDEQ